MVRRALILLGLLLLFGAVGCGDEEDSGGEAEAPRTEAAGPEAPEAALTDTSTKPVVPQPSGEPPRRLVIEDIVKGNGPAAKTGSTVLVHYVGLNFSNGQQFDASWDSGSPFPVQLGTGGVIPGWEKGLVGIRKGGRRKLTIPPELGYGAQGYPPDIPPNETLVFVVDALSVE